MGARLVQTRGGCMLIIRRTKRRRLRHKARHKGRNVSACKHWHGEAAQLYHEQLMKAQPLKADPQGSVRDIPTASQNAEPLSPSQGKVMAAPAPAEESYLAWFDGACKPVNPGGTASFGVVIEGEDATVLLRDHGVVGQGEAMSNNVAEYAGVCHILRYLASRPPGRVTIRGDSNLVINQLSGYWRIKKGLYLPIATETKELLADLRGLGWQIDFCWIPREQNKQCDALSRRGPSGISKNASQIRNGGSAERKMRPTDREVTVFPMASLACPT